MPKAYFVNRKEIARQQGNGYNQAYHDDDVDDDELEQVDWETTFQRDMVLFCIDAGQSMHRTNSSGYSNLYAALKAAASLMEKKLISSPHDQAGVMLFNTKETLFKSAKPGEYYKGSYELLTINQVNVPDTFNLKNVLKEVESDPQYLETFLPPSEKQMRIDWALANAGVAMVSAPNSGSKRVFFITDNDDPHPLLIDPKSTKTRRACIEKMFEFKKIGVKFESFFISDESQQADGKFQINHFYADVFEQYDDDDDQEALDESCGTSQSFSKNVKGQESKLQLWDSATRFEELEKDVTTKETPKRVIFNIRFELAPLGPIDRDANRLPSAKTKGKKWQIGVKGYSLISKATKGNPVKVIVDDECGELKEVVTHQHYIDANTGQPLVKEQVIPAFQFGNNNTLRGHVQFNKEELKQIKSFGMLPCLKLLGFKDRSEFQFQDNVKHAYFIYPSDTEWRGSKKAFAALLNSMVRMGKVGLGLFMPRQNVVPVFVAILPQAEEVVDGQQLNPPGMHLITLPFADDVRDVPEPVATTETANDAEVDAAKLILDRFQKKLAFNPDHYPNPSLNHHYKVLMATAFQEPIPEEIEDHTRPQYATIQKRAGHLIEAFHQEIENDSRTVISAPTVVKTSTNTRKSTFENDQQIVQLWEKGKLAAFTVDELRSACEFYRIDKKGRKAELVARLQGHLDKIKR